MTLNPAAITGLALPALLVFVIYRRVRRNIGRQRSKLWRHWCGVIFCPLLLALMALGAMRSLDAEGALALGIAAGIGLGVYGQRLTRFENDGPVFYYTPNPYLGLGLSALLIARFGYRAWTMYQLYGHMQWASDPDFARSPLTLGLAGVVFAYYFTYSLGLLRWRLRSRLPAPV